MSTSYSAITVANSILRIAKNRGVGISPMKLLKLVYIAHGWHLAMYNEPLIKDRIEAWKYGPVVPSVYFTARHYGNSEISQYLVPDLWDDEYTLAVPQEDLQTNQLLQQVWDGYGHFSAVQLSAMTHRKGSPWFTTWYEKGGKDRSGTDIDESLIREHFIEIGKKRTS